MSSASAQQARRVVLTVSIAAITATGAWYGAGLKTRQEFKKEKQSVMEASPSDNIQRLEDVRSNLVKKKTDLQAKINRIEARAASSQDLGKPPS